MSTAERHLEEGCAVCNSEVESANAAVGALAEAASSPTPSGMRERFQARLNREAFDHGCDLAMMVAVPGSDSQRNAERNGFRIAYTRTKWKLCS